MVATGTPTLYSSITQGWNVNKQIISTDYSVIKNITFMKSRIPLGKNGKLLQEFCAFSSCFKATVIFLWHLQNKNPTGILLFVLILMSSV